MGMPPHTKEHERVCTNTRLIRLRFKQSSKRQVETKIPARWVVEERPMGQEPWGRHVSKPQC